MAMTREFSWNRNSGNTLEAAAKAFELAQAAASEEYWKEREREDAMQAAVEAQKADVGARYPELVTPAGAPTGAPSEAYQQAKAEQDAIIQQKVARLKELEMARAEKIAKFRDNPNFKMAAMLAMAGQPGALQAMLTEGSKSGKSAQADMDVLERSIQSDLTYLAGTNKDQRDKALSVSIPLFKAKLKELIDAGAVSRMGGLEAWDKVFEDFKTKGRDKDAAAAAKKVKHSSLDID